MLIDALEIVARWAGYCYAGFYPSAPTASSPVISGAARPPV